MATDKTTEKAGKSKAPAVQPKSAPSGDAAIKEMGAEDESPSDAHHSRDKTGPTKKPKR